MSFAIAALPGRRFEEDQGNSYSCKGCAFYLSPDNGNTLTDHEKAKGCNAIPHCGDARIIIKEVGFDPSNP